jgi:hypothetical protein
MARILLLVVFLVSIFTVCGCLSIKSEKTTVVKPDKVKVVERGGHN